MTTKTKEQITPSDQPKLTQRELQVALALADGKSYPEIGKGLSLSTEAIRSHATGLRKKTGRHKQVQLSLWANDNRQWLLMCLNGGRPE